MYNLVDSAGGTTWRTCWSSPVPHSAHRESLSTGPGTAGAARRIGRTIQNSHPEPSFTWGLGVQLITLFQVGPLSPLNPLSQLCRDWMEVPVSPRETTTSPSWVSTWHSPDTQPHHSHYYSSKLNFISLTTCL